jgi:hypothetical protein
MYFIRRPRDLGHGAKTFIYQMVYTTTDDEGRVAHEDLHFVRFQILGDRAVVCDNWQNWEAGNLEEAREHAAMLLRLGYRRIAEEKRAAA